MNNKVLTFALIFSFVLCLTYLTPLIADDFTYMNSFADGDRISNFFDVIESMSCHWRCMNGRVVAHGIVQLFLMYPKIVFDVFNSLLVLVEFVLILHLSGVSAYSKEYVYYLLLLFSFTWLFTPAYGEVYLWLDGAINYHWASVVLLVYLLPFYHSLSENNIKAPCFILQFLFVIYGFVAGSYSENASLTVVGLALLSIIVNIFQKKVLKYI